MSTTAPQRASELEIVTAAVTQNRFLLLGFFLTVEAAAVGVTLLTTPEYTATAVIHVLARAGMEVNVTEVVRDDNGGYMEQRERRRTQIQIIQSRSVREEVLRRYNELGHTDLMPDDDGLKEFASRLAVAPQEDTELLNISVTHEDPKKAALLANLTTDVCGEESLQRRTTAARETQQWLAQPIESYRNALEDAADKVLEFKRENGRADIDGVDSTSTRLDALQQALSETVQQRALLETKLGEYTRLLDTGEYQTLAGMLEDPVLETMLKDLAAYQASSASILAVLTHPQRPEISRNVEQRLSMIKATVKQLVAGLQSRLATLRRQEGDIIGKIERARLELVEAQRVRGEFEELKRREDQARTLYEQLASRSEEVGLQARTRLNTVSVVDRATPPARASKPNKLLNLAVATLLGLFGGVGLAVLRYTSRDTLRTPEDASRLLPAPLLGAIPQLPARIPASERDLYGHHHPHSELAEAFRGLRAMIAAGGDPMTARRFVVTSAWAGEGASTVTMGLAVAFAQAGVRVLVVDANLRKPRMHQIFQIPRTPGLTAPDAAGDGDVARLVRRTPITNLYLLRSGDPVDDPQQVLSNLLWRNALPELDRYFQVLLFDTPPVGIVADALTLAPEAEGVVMVVRADDTPRKAVVAAIARCEQAGARVSGVVLTGVTNPQARVGYRSKYYDDSARTAAPAPTTP